MADPNPSNIEQEEDTNVGGNSVQEGENADENAGPSGSNVQEDDDTGKTESNGRQDDDKGEKESNVQQDDDKGEKESNVQQDEDQGESVQQDEDKGEKESNVQQDDTGKSEGEIQKDDDADKHHEVELSKGGDAVPSDSALLSGDVAEQVARIATDILSEIEVGSLQESTSMEFVPGRSSREDTMLSDEGTDRTEGTVLTEENVAELQALLSDEEIVVSTPGEEMLPSAEAKEEETVEEAETPLDVQPTEAVDEAVEKPVGEEAVEKPVDEDEQFTTTETEGEAEISEGPDSTVTVKILLLPLEEMVTVTCSLEDTIRDVKMLFWRRMKMEPVVLKIRFNGEIQKDPTPLFELGIEENETIYFELESRDPEHFPLKPCQRKSYIPDIHNISIVNRKGEGKQVAVEVLQPTRAKPFLGGFRHKTSRAEFHNASSQTKPVPLRWPTRTLFTRDTQTKQVSNQKLQTPQDTSTQMTKIGCYVSVKENRLHTPGKYVTSKEKEDVKLQKVLILQTYFRRHLAWKAVDKVRKQKEARLQFEKDQALKRQQEKENRIKAEFLRRQCPRSRKDFNTLYDALEKWRLQEIAKINATLTGAERKAALYMLLNQEMEHLAAIRRHQAIADEIIAKKNIESFLNKTAAPRSIISSYDNQKTLIDTPYTIRARELQEIYNNLIINNFTLDERLDILLTLKYTVREHDCKLSYEITCLVDREADLLMRGVSNHSLVGLRKRIATLFLQYIKTPMFNPEAARYTALPPLTKNLKVYYCASCNKFYSSTQFPLNVNAQVPGPCKMCMSKDNEGRLRRDFNIYKYMLKSLQSREERYKDNSTIAFLLQDSDICYLVEKIWNSESIISNCNDLYDLIWIRWNKDEVWSPWNCLLVTFEEAEIHNKSDDLEVAYGEVFVNKVHQKHLLAKSHFSRLPWLDRQINQPKELDLSAYQRKDGKYLSKKTSCNLFPKA